MSDRFGRRWPLTCNLLLCCDLSLSTCFVQMFHQFLAVQSLFGIAMGGIWGLAASTALGNLPVELRDLWSGIFQQGYAVGYLLSAVDARYLYQGCFCLCDISPSFEVDLIPVTSCNCPSWVPMLHRQTHSVVGEWKCDPR